LHVAALYDIHGNLPALEAVLAEVERERADAIVVGGDIAGGAFPAETLDRLRALGGRAHWIRGNVERELVEEPPPRAAGPPPGELERLRAQLSDEQIAFLYELPRSLDLDVDGLGHVLFCHAVPENDLDIVTPLSPAERVERILAAAAADVVVAGHTHMQDDRRLGNARWVNAGSVGMPYEDVAGARWAMLGPDVELRRTPYDVGMLGTYEYPQASRQEAAEYFESLVRD
jgi:putative phosphoesterase